MLKRCIAIMALMSLSFNGIAQGSLWSKTSSRLHTMSQSEIPQESAQFTLNTNALSNLLFNVPSRLNQKTSNTLINLPNENGEFNQYEVLEASNFHPDLAAKYPNIKSYIARGIDTNSMARISYGPSLGLTIAITNLDRSTTLIKPIDVSNNVYAVYSRASIIEDASAFECSTIEEAKSAFNQTSYDENRNADDSTLRRYRVAISTTGEYSQFYLDGTETTDEERKGKVLEALNQSLTRINGIFERDFAVTMELVPNNDAVIFLNASTDPYNVSNSAVQNAIDNAIGNDNYDVGHLYAYEGSIYGNAGCIACVCTPGAKGQAFTVHSAPDSDNFNMIASHEFGHQFGGWHVQSSANCRSSAGLQEVEPGSGSTIMGYAGICSPNVQAGPDDYFNYVDIRDVAQWTINDSSCAQLIDLSNNAPTTSAGDDYTIPRSTAFVLEGEGSDPDADDISFCWEENDPENPNSTDTPQPTRVFGPMFRSKLPVASPDRYMPQLDDVVAGNLLATWEMLPSVSRTMDFVLTVRDNALNGGQTASDEMTVTVTDTAGPFVVTSQATPETWNVGENTTITWDVANTNVAPVSATEVDVFLSIDGGYTYPYALAAGIVNDGSEVINIPNIPTTTEARVMVRGANNIFFAINASNFEIQASEFVMNFTEVNQAVCKPDDAIYNFTYNTFLGFDETTTFSALNLPDGAIATFNPPTAVNDNTNVVLTISNTNAVANGTYDITVNGMSPSAEKNTAISLEVYDSGLVAPALQSPANNATAVDVNATFEWLEDPNAANYELEVALDAAFNTVVIDVTTTATTYQVSGLDFNTTYFWRVRSTNTCGISAYSSINEFITFCVAPSNVAISNTLVDTAQLAWLENGNANTWEVEVIAQGAMPTGVGISTTDNPYTISGLSSITTYDAYVRSACGGENYSDWTGPITFTTAADFCNGDPFYDSGGPDGNYSNNEFVTTVIAPSGASNNITVEFTAFELESGYDYLFIYDGPDTGAPLLGQFSGTTNPGPFTSTHPTGTLTFVFTSDGSVTYSGWEAIVSCNFISCPNPGDLAASDITLSSATINWTSGGNETSWELEYGESGFTQGSGTTLQVATNPYDLTGLDLETSYDVYLRGNCGANPGEDDSDWIGPITFSTLGLAAPGYLNAELTNESLGEVTLEWGEPSDFIGSWMLFFDFSCSDAYNQTEIIFDQDGTFSVPEFSEIGTWTLIDDQITFTFSNNFSYYGTRTGDYMEGTNDGDGCWYSTKINGGDPIEYASGSNDVFGNLNTHANQSITVVSSPNADSQDFIEYNLYRNNQLILTTTSNNYVDTLPDYGTYEYYVTAVYDEGESSPSNIEVIEWISCPEPTDLQVTNETLSSAQIGWTTNGTESSWELEYGEAGFTQGTGTTLQVATNPYDLTGLDLETTYDVYLRGNCGANPGEDDSVWIGPATFSTLGVDPPGPLSAELTNDETGEVSLTWSEPSAVAGSWLFNYSNGCDGTYFQVELLVYNDGTFYFPDFGDGGTWELVGDQITFDYNNGFLIVGTVDGNSMIGTYDGGCWYADKIQGDTTDYIIPQTSIAGQLIANSGQTATIVADPSDFIEFNLYRDGQLLATTTATAYIDTLPDYGTYQYYVTAVYDEGESSPTNIEIIEWIDFCSGSHFYDSGGVDGNYQNNEDITTVIEPGSGFDRVTVTFISFELEGCCDYLAVYDGLDTNAPFLGQYNGTSIPESFTANNASGALTFRFTSDSSVTYSGWDAIITCESISCPDPTNLEVAEVTIDTALITWTPGGDETMWEVEFGDPGFTQGTGAVVQVDAPFAEFSNLLPNSSLDVYIRANCGINPGEDDSNWIGPVTFTTLDTTAPGFLTAELTNSNDGEVTLSWGEPSDFTGSWLLNFDHGCNNNYNQVEIIFNEDNTFFIPSENNSGTWELTGDQITWTFDNDFQYNGTLTGNNYMEGVMDSGGCWFADKLNGQDYIEYVVGDLSSNQLVNENANQVITIAPQVFDFIEYNVYRDSQLIASTIDTNYIDTLPEFGTYDYYVTAVYDEGESDPSNTETVVWDNLSVEGFNLKDLKLYPNPVSSILTVSYTQNISSVEVFSILGQNVLNIDTDSNINTIDMSQLEAGTYFVKVYVGTNFNIYKVVKK